MDTLGELEKKFKEIELSLNIQTIRKAKAVEHIHELQRELGRIDKRIEELSRDIILLINKLSKTKK